MAQSTRKPYLDRIRWCTVLVVIGYHVLYQFNSLGIIRNISTPGIPILDAPLSFVYPWFMGLLFVVAGMSARYSLQKRTGKAFLKDRFHRLLIPSIAGIFLLGWTTGWVTAQADFFVLPDADSIPGFVIYLIYCMSGIGPLWFAHELFAGCVLLLLLRSIDKQDRLWQVCGKAGWPVLLLLVFPVWGSSKILNTPVIEVYRNGIYWFLFLLGYFLFSHEEVTGRLAKCHLPLLIAGCVTGICYTAFHYGENYTTQDCLQSFFTNAYAWLMILATLGTFKARWNITSPLSDYMTVRNFGFYVLHNPLLVLIAYAITTYFHLPVLCDYLLVLAGTLLLLPPLYELIHRIPVLKTLLLGE